MLAGTGFMLILAIVAIVGVSYARDHGRRHRSLEQRSEVVVALENLRYQGLRGAAMLSATAFTEDVAPLVDLYREAVEERSQAFDQSLAGLKALGDDDGVAVLEQFAAEIDQEDAATEALIEAALATDISTRIEMGQLYFPLVWPTAEARMAGLSQLSLREQAELASARTADHRASQMTTALMGGLSAVALTGGTALVVMLVFSVVRPLGLLRRSVKAIIQGDLSARAEVSGPNEVASLARDFNLMVAGRQHAEDGLRQVSRQNELVLRAAGEGIFGVDRQGRTTFANPAAAQMLGCEVGDLIGQTPFDVMHRLKPDGSPYPQEECLVCAAINDGTVHRITDELFWRKDGTSFPVEYIVTPIRDDHEEILGAVVTFRDITERKRYEGQLVHLASHDPLTDLFNRRRLEEELDRELAEAERYGTHGALVFLDLDQFKDVNDSLGHGVGDELLANLAVFLRRRLRKTDIVARPGGDEFCIMLPHTDAKEADAVARQLIETVQRHAFVAGGRPITVTASAGVAFYPEHGDTAEELLARADLAMYQAKEDGRNTYRVYAPERNWQEEIGSRLGWRNRIQEAMEKDRLMLYAQPILDLPRNRISQYELLLRLDGGDKIVPAKAFIDLAERFGMIQAIDRWVVTRAVHIIAEQERNGRDLRLEVNLSGKAFSDAELLPLIQQELEATSIDPASLVLEVTETAAIANIGDAQGFVRTLKGLGCRFALDDFGVGFSSFNQLKHLPVDYLKIDGSFVLNLPVSPVDQHMVRAMVQVARGLAMKTIAEFVGDEQTLRWLREHGVDYAQGYHIGRPREISELLRDDTEESGRAA